MAELPKSIVASKKMDKEGLSKKQFMLKLVEDKQRTFAELCDNGIKRPTLVMWGKNDPTVIVE